MTRRRTILGAALLLLVLIGWGLRPVVRPVEEPVTSGAARAPTQRPQPTSTAAAAEEEEEEPPWMDPPAQVRRRQRAALDLVAEASDRAGAWREGPAGPR